MRIFVALWGLLAMVGVVSLVGCEVFENSTPSDCGPGAIVVGESGSFSQQVLNFDWDGSEDDVWYTNEPLRFSLPSDMVGAIFSLLDEGNVPVIGEALLDGRLVGGAIDTQGQTPLSRVSSMWNNAVSIGFPSNNRTVPGQRRCVDLELYSVGLESSSPQLLITSTRRPASRLGTHFELELRVVDDAIDMEEAEDFARELPRYFSSLCGANLCPQPVISTSVMFIDTPWDGDIVVDGDMSPAEMYAQIASQDIAGSAPRSLKLVFVNSLSLGSIGEHLTTLGLAGGIPSVPKDGTAASSLFVAVEAHRVPSSYQLSHRFLAQTVAHEVGHMMGLFHTTEADGAVFDPIADTDECAAERYGTNAYDQVDSEICRDVGADNLMFWMGGSASSYLTSEQTFVLRSHPLTYIPTQP